MNDADLLRLARERYQAGIDGDKDNRDRDELDRKFYKGEQWAKDDRTARGNRPTVTVNRCPQFVKQITGEMRQNKPAIRVLPVDDRTDEKLAEVYTAIIRHIESGSDAHRIYSKAGEQAVIGGIGWFRILTDYMDAKSFDQEIMVKLVRNPMSVVVDPGAIELTRCDMQWAFVTELVPEEQFKAVYPKAKLDGWPSDDTFTPWKSDKKIRVAEYWQRTKKPRDLLLLSDGSTRYSDEMDDEELALLGESGVEIVKKRKVDAWSVKCDKITGNEVLESYEWAGSYIPLIPVIGEEVEVGDEVFRHGLIHHSKDSQRAYNFARSAMVEHVAMQPKAPLLASAAMIKNHTSAWKGLNTGNPPALLFDFDPLAPGQFPRRAEPPTFAAAWYQEAMIADGDMKATTGIYDASLGKQSNETSGIAIRARDQQGETGSYVYVDNLEAAIRHTGIILIELIPEIYTAERVIRIMGEDGAIEGYEKINTMMPDGTVWNDISVGQFDLQVDTGPAFATKRAEAAERLTGLIQAVPQIAAAVPDLLIKVFDLPYGQKIADRLGLMMVPPGVDIELDKKRMELQQQMQQLTGPQQPDPMQEMAQASAVADIQNKHADTELKQAKAAQTVVQTEIDTQTAHIDAYVKGASMGDGPKTAEPAY